METPLPSSRELESEFGRDLVQQVRDRALRDFRKYLLGQCRMNEELKRRLDALGWGDREMSVVWALLFELGDYTMHAALDFVEYQCTTGRLTVQLRDDGGIHDVDTDMLPGRYIGWSEQYGTMSPDWKEPDRKA